MDRDKAKDSLNIETIKLPEWVKTLYQLDLLINDLRRQFIQREYNRCHPREME